MRGSIRTKLGQNHNDIWGEHVWAHGEPLTKPWLLPEAQLSPLVSPLVSSGTTKNHREVVNINDDFVAGFH